MRPNDGLGWVVTDSCTRDLGEGLPPAWTLKPGSGDRQFLSPVKLTIKDRAGISAGVQIVPFDISLDGKRYGELFDFIVLGRTATP